MKNVKIKKSSQFKEAFNLKGNGRLHYILNKPKLIKTTKGLKIGIPTLFYDRKWKEDISYFKPMEYFNIMNNIKKVL
jgi:protein associated with RNAse G/E